MAKTILSFRHRENSDGTFDSICLQCFQTIANVKDERDLFVFEGNHICEGFDLGRLFYSH